MHRAIGVQGHVSMEIGDICNTLDRQRLRRCVDEHSYMIRIHRKVKDKYVLGYYVSTWLRDFFIDTNRSRDLYSTSLVIGKCQKTINSLILAPNPHFYNNLSSLKYFFTPTPTPTPPSEIPIDNIANATRLLERARNGSDRNELLLFLQYLSEIHWSDIYNRGGEKRHLTTRIMHWVCTTLVGWFLPLQFGNPFNCNSIQESSSLEPGDIRDAMCKVLTEILSCGILPALSQHISRASELGIFEKQYCLGCLPRDVPGTLLSYLSHFEELSQILPMFTGQSLFQTLTTRVVESVLLGMALSMRYVWIYIWLLEVIDHTLPVISLILAGKSCHGLIFGSTEGRTLQIWLHPKWRFQSRSVWDI